MKRAMMPEITSFKKFKVSEGWIAEIPTFGADEEYVARLRGALMADYNNHVIKAEAEARDRIDRMGRNEFLTRLKDMVKQAADTYARRFPDLVQPDRSLAGFDPSRIQRFFVPYRPSPGRDGTPAFKAELVAMATEARSRAKETQNAA
jgi:hypothetical protein